MREKLTYHREGDYLIPDLMPSESPNIGIWGERRRQFLRNHQRPVYDAMQMSGTLNAHLEEIAQAAEVMLDCLVTQIAQCEGVTEQLKAEDQISWMQRMNHIRTCAEDIVMSDLIND